MLDSIVSKKPIMSKSQRMRYELLRAKAMNKSYKKFTFDSVMLQVANYYKHHGDDRDRLTAYYLLGCVYRDLNDAPAATRTLNKATEYARGDRYSLQMLCRIHSQMADLYGDQALVEMEISELEQSSRYALLSGDTIDAIALYNQKSSAYSLIDELDSAAKINKAALQMYKDIGCESYAAQISLSSIRYYLKEKQFAEAKRRFDFYEEKSGYFSDGEIESGREVYYYLKALYYLGVNKTDSAETLFRKCLSFKEDANMALAAYHGLSLLYQKIAIPDSTAKYAMLAYNANDSCYKEKTARILLQQQSIYNYDRYKEKAERSAEHTVALQRWLILSIVTLVLLAFLAFVVHRKKKRESIVRTEMMRERYETEKALLNKEIEELSSLSERRKSLILHKNKQMEAREKELTREIDEKGRYIEELKGRIEDYKRELDIKDIAQMEDEIQRDEVKSQFEYYLKNVRESPTSTQWRQLGLFAKRSTPRLFIMLRSNNVSEREFRVCVLVRLMFKPGDIAALIGCSIADVSQTRSRLLKKIYHIDGSPSELDKRIRLMY